MKLKQKARIMNKAAVQRTITRIAHEILEKNKNTKDLCIIGIRKGGAVIARRLAGRMEEISRKPIPLGILDITLYRDDLTAIAEQPIVHKTEINFDITAKTVILVDDVLFTGRTIRCALDELIDFGRPSSIQLAILIDRGHRELPIRADYVGKNVPTAGSETIEVRLEESEGIDEVLVMEQEK
ncbi:MAG: bifunctional pyr operon transcriptional regulator/uracil phosphoribosyltransferase PyrR [Candidatus Omnitrophota bacterium]|nr:bifunctional pyr operon transcriptional regulator/uracil phosphoribosyltransferase PyrR [Candidatus Omnitrophota bacterium]